MNINERGRRNIGMDPYDLFQRDMAEFEGMGREYRPVIQEPSQADLIRANGDGMILRIPVRE